MKIGNKEIGAKESTFVIAEIGINHNGDMDITKKLIDVAKDAGCDAVKFQKRMIDAVYSKDELDRFRESPWGTTNREQKNGLELSKNDYIEIDKYCKEKNILWFASCWDEDSVDFIDQFNPPCYKIASSSLTDKRLLEHTAKKGKPIILSTGMSTMEEIESAVKFVEGFTSDILLMHCTSTYPSVLEELNLNVITVLKEKFNHPIGYSGHSTGIIPPVMAITLGACAVEKHITLDRAMYGSDQPASIEPPGLEKMISYIRGCNKILGNGIKRVYESETPIKEKLRRI